MDGGGRTESGTEVESNARSDYREYAEGMFAERA
jgi:hypothetical protein